MDLSSIIAEDEVDFGQSSKEATPQKSTQTGIYHKLSTDSP